MAITQRQKRSAAGSSDPLLDLNVLQIVLSYVGPGHCLFVALVSKWWRELYFGVDSQQLAIDPGCSRETDVIGVPQMTLYSSVFASPPRVKLAHLNGLDCTLKKYRQAAGKYADITISCCSA
jgi:hypothetical protein